MKSSALKLLPCHEHHRSKVSTKGCRKLSAIAVTRRAIQSVIVTDKLQKHSEFSIQVTETYTQLLSSRFVLEKSIFL